MPASRKSKKTCKGALKTGNTATISNRSRSNGQTIIPASPVSDPFKDPDPSTGPLSGYQSFEHEDTGDKGSPKYEGREARQDDWKLGSSAAPVDKSGKTLDMWTAIMQLRATIIALDTVNRECIARCDDLEKGGEMDAFKINVLEELVTFLTLKMDAHLEIVNHVRVLGHRPKVTAGDLYRAGLWPHDLSSGNGKEQPSPTDLPNMETVQEPSSSSQTSHPERDDKVASMSSRSDEPTALSEAESATKIPVASLLSDDLPSRYQRSSEPSQKRDVKRVQIEIATAEDHNKLLAEIAKLKQQTRDLCLKVAKYADISGQLTGQLTRRGGSIAGLERRVGLIYLVSRLHGGDQKAPDNIRDVFIGKKNNNTGEGSRVKALMDSVLLDTTNLANDNDTGIKSLDIVKHSQLDGKLTREGSSISGPQEGLSTGPVEDISTITLNISQDQQLGEEEGTKTLNVSQDHHLVEGEGKNSRSEETADARRDKSVHKVIEGQKLQKAEYPQKPKSTTTLNISQDQQLGEEEGTKTLNVTQDHHLVEGEGKNSRSEETADARRDKSVHKVIEGQKLQKAEYPQKPKSTTTLNISQDQQLGEEEGTKTLNVTQDQHLVEGEGKNSRSEETADARRDKSVHKVIEGQKLQKAEYSQKLKSQQDEIEESARLHDEILLPQIVVEEASENGLNGSLEEREFASAAEAFLRNFTISLMEQDKAKGSEMLDELVKENAYLTEQMKILASLNLKPGLLAREDAALILASIKTPRRNQPRQPLQVDSIEPTDNDVHDKSTSQDLSTQRTRRISQSGKRNSDSGLQGEISKTQPQVEFKRTVMEDFHDEIFLSQSKDRRQPVVDRSGPTPPDVAENKGQVNNDRERKHDGQPRKADFSTQLGANTTAEMPLRSANSPQEKHSCPQSSSTAEKAREATDEEYEADSEWETKVGGNTATLHVPQEVEYVHYGYDHPFL